MSQSIKDHHREGLTLNKILQVFRMLLPRNTVVLARMRHFTDLDLKILENKLGRPIKGLIIDVDECLSYNRGKLIKSNVDFLFKLKKRGIKIVLYSNMIWSPRYEILGGKIEVLTNIVAKPNKAGYLQAVKKLGLKRSEVIMIGDNIFTDGGSVRAGIPFVKVAPIRTVGEVWWVQILRIPQRISRFFYDMLSRFHDLFREKPIKLP